MRPSDQSEMQIGLEEDHEPAGQPATTPDVFISYEHEDADLALSLQGLLQKQNWTVWSDESIRPGERWDDAIERALHSVRCVVVIWTKNSTKSSFVRAEAREAARLAVLVPVTVDDVEPPLEFSGIQHAALNRDLTGPRSEMDSLLRSIASLVGAEYRAAPRSSPPFLVMVRRRPVVMLLGLLVLVAGLGAFYFLQPSDRPERPLIARINMDGSPRTVAGLGGTVWAYDGSTGDLWKVSTLDHSLVRGEVPDGFELAVSGDTLWISSLRGTIVRGYDHAFRLVATADVGGQVDDIVVGHGSVWLAQRQLGQVARVDIRDHSVIWIPVQGAPTSLAVAASGIWITDSDAGTVRRVDQVTNQVSDPIDVGSSPLGIAATETEVWVANTADGTVSVIDAGRRAVVATANVGAQPHDIAVTDWHAWVVNAGDGTVTQLNRSSLKAVQTVAIGISPERIASVGNQIWLTDPEEEALFTFSE